MYFSVFLFLKTSKYRVSKSKNITEIWNNTIRYATNENSYFEFGESI